MKIKVILFEFLQYTLFVWRVGWLHTVVDSLSLMNKHIQADMVYNVLVLLGQHNSQNGTLDILQLIQVPHWPYQEHTGLDLHRNLDNIDLVHKWYRK